MAFNANHPHAVLSFPVAAASAVCPIPTLRPPETLVDRLPLPIATFSRPSTFLSKLLIPTATLLLPIVFVIKALYPTAVLLIPVIYAYAKSGDYNGTSDSPVKQTVTAVKTITPDNKKIRVVVSFA